MVDMAVVAQKGNPREDVVDDGVTVVEREDKRDESVW